MSETGGCLCGAIRYELDAPLGPTLNCHCQYCRRAHGAAFVTIAWLPRAAVRFSSGENLIREYETPVGRRAFCERCGSRLYNAAAFAPDFVSLIVGSLDEQPEEAPLMHLNVESKARWYEILDGRPQHAALPRSAEQALADAAATADGDPP